MSILLLATKLYIPPPRPNLVSRPRLIRRLDEGLRQGPGGGFFRKLTLLSAPAGYGKTTLVVDWLSGFRSDPASEVPAALGRRKKVVFSAVAGLCALALGALMHGMMLKPAKTAAPASAPKAEPVPIKIYHFLPSDDFVIPFQRESNHYMSLSLSLRSADGAAMNELNTNREMYRGIIYDLLKANADKAVGHPSLAATEERLADNLNTWLTSGRIDEVYITRFVIK